MPTNLIKIFEEPVEDGDEVGGGHLLAEDGAQLVDRGGQGAPHLPLHVISQTLVRLPEQGPVSPAQC